MSNWQEEFGVQDNIVHEHLVRMRFPKVYAIIVDAREGEGLTVMLMLAVHAAVAVYTILEQSI